MECPVCKTKQLVMSERQGIEIDYCPQCRGVWLDRGELDKILERSESEAMSTRPSRPAAPGREYSPGRDYSGGYSEPYHGHYRQKKRKGLLSEIFDF